MLSLRPSHRNPNELQPEVCELCGSLVGHQHLMDVDVEGLRGYKVCDLHRFERIARVTPSLNDYRVMNPPVPSPDVARQQPIGGAIWFTGLGVGAVSHAPAGLLDIALRRL